jgi:hypothetical protein
MPSDDHRSLLVFTSSFCGREKTQFLIDGARSKLTTAGEGGHQSSLPNSSNQLPFEEEKEKEEEIMNSFQFFFFFH